MVICGVMTYSQTVGDTFIDNFVTYEITSLSPNEVEAINYDMAGGTAVNLPATVTNSTQSYSVTAIGDDAFRNKQLVSVSITPNSVTYIGADAFRNNQLTSIVIPNGVTSLDDNAFGDNALTSIDIADSVTNIEAYVFFGNNLTDFSNVVLPIGLTAIPEGSFYGNQLIDLSLPSTIVSIEEDAFAFNQIVNLTIPQNVTIIRENSFQNNQLTSVTIPENVTLIGDWAFGDNPLTCVIATGLTPPTITSSGNTTFSNPGSIDVTVPANTTSAYIASGWTGFNSISEGLTGTFVVDNITYEVISSTNNTVRTTDYNVVGGTVVNVPAMVSQNCITYSVTEIGPLSFNNSSLTAITLPDSIQSIGGFAFSGNQSITNVTLPNNLVTINNHAFANCGLTSITIPNSVTSIGFSAFQQNQNLATAVLPNGISSIGENAFFNCGLTSVNIPTSLTLIETGVFANNNLTAIALPNGITSIGQFAFRFNNINNLVIPDSVIEIEALAFDSNSISSLDLGSGVQIIGNEAFKFNPPLQSVTIPASVTAIGDGAFATPGLTDVFSESLVPATITTSASPNDTFAIDRSTVHLHIPPGTLGVYVTDPGALWTAFNPITEDVVLSTDDFELNNTVKIITQQNNLEIVTNNDLQLNGYEVYTLSGSKVATGHTFSIQTETFTKGIYILKLYFDKGVVTKKVIVY